MIIRAQTTVDYVWERKQHLWQPRRGENEWVDRHGGYDSETEAREAINKFVRDWPRDVDEKYRAAVPREFRIMRIETTTEILGFANVAGDQP